MKSLSNFLNRKLKLKINETKSAVARPWKRKFLGFTVYIHQEVKCKVSPEAIKRFKGRVREITRRTREISLRCMISKLAKYLKGWMAYFGIAEIAKTFKELNKWIRRRLRSMIWKQWGRSGYRKLLQLGVSRELAWNTF